MVYIARRFENTCINLEDLISIGTIGLINAVETYRDNLQFIKAMNRTAEKNYNGFTGRVLERGYRYNQGLSSKYMLLEIGYNRNDIADCRNTRKHSKTLNRM